MELHSKPASLSFTAKESKQRKTKKSRFLFCKPSTAGNKKTLSSQTRQHSLPQTSSQANIPAGNKIYEINESEGQSPSEPSLCIFV